MDVGWANSLRRLENKVSGKLGDGCSHSLVSEPTLNLCSLFHKMKSGIFGSSRPWIFQPALKCYGTQFLSQIFSTIHVQRLQRGLWDISSPHGTGKSWGSSYLVRPRVVGFLSNLQSPLKWSWKEPAIILNYAWKHTYCSKYFCRP